MNLKILQTAILVFIVSFSGFAQSTTQNDEQFIKTFWDKLSFTSQEAKILPFISKKFPYWIPAFFGGAALVTGTVLVLNKKDDDVPTLPAPIARDDQIQITCGQSSTIDPLTNDTGTSIMVISFSGHPQGSVSLEGNVFSFANDIKSSFIFSYTIRDSIGQTASANVSVNVSLPPISVPDKNVNAQSGEIISGNIFEGAQCTQCIVQQVTSNTSSVPHWDMNGSFQFTVPPASQPTQFILTFTMTDLCGQSTTAKYTIQVQLSICDVQIDFDSTPANCGMEDGAISIIGENLTGYTILWSNGQTGIKLTQVPSGNYSVTLTNPALSCTKSFETSLSEKPPDYLRDIRISSGNCYQSGSLTFFMNGLHSGPYLLQVSGMAGNFNFEIQAGNIDVVSLIHSVSPVAIITGLYVLTVSDPTKGDQCKQTTTVEIPIDPVVFTLFDDVFTIDAGKELQGNVLLNDIGTEMRVTGHSIQPNATLNILPDGSFVFRSAENFEGQLEYTYTVQDVCNRFSTAKLLIHVTKSFCDYQVTFTTVTADCGGSNGAVVANIFPNDLLQLQWSNGEQGNVLSQVPAGTYELVITNPATGCTQSFSVNVPEISSPYVTKTEVIHETCNNKAGIVLFTNAPVSGSMHVSVQGPGVFHEFVTPQGEIMINNFVPLVAGLWTITVRDVEAENRCAETYTFELKPYLGPILTLLDFEPPSSPIAKDGIVFVEITGGVPPYRVTGGPITFHNLVPGFNVLNGFPAGFYTLIATDAQNCNSNAIFLELFGNRPAFRITYNTYQNFHLPVYQKKNPELPGQLISERNNDMYQSAFAELSYQNYFISLGGGVSGHVLRNVDSHSENSTKIQYISVAGGQKIHYGNHMLSLSVGKLQLSDMLTSGSDRKIYTVADWFGQMEWKIEISKQSYFSTLISYYNGAKRMIAFQSFNFRF